MGIWKMGDKFEGRKILASDLNMVPHLGKDTIEFLDKKVLTKDMVMLEFGSGTSTIWFAKRVKQLYSVETNKEWFDRVSAWLREEKVKNVEMLWYDKRLPKGVKYDVILIDDDVPVDSFVLDLYEHPRNMSIRRAEKVIKPDGFIIIDDDYPAHSGECGYWLMGRGWELIQKSSTRSQHTSVYRRKKMDEIEYDETKTICVDFDGVIHKYSKGFQKGEIYDPPIEGAIDALHKLVDRGYNVVILTSRNETIPNVEEWVKKHLGPDIKVTNRKIPAIAYIDDRAIRFTNWADILRYFT